MRNSYFNLTVSELLACIKEQKILVEDIALSFIERYEKIEKNVRAWADYDKKLFLNQAQEIDNKIKNNSFLDEDLLLGIPIGVKDTYNTEYFNTKRGSEIYTDYRAGNDARIVRKARDFGAIIAGKTATAEFSIHYPSNTLNPHNLEHTPGTSSGGSAVAVATGMVPLAFGTQTAASTSKPASYCGIYGFKPTFGLFPRTGVLKTCDTLDTLSFFTRSVEDIELVFNTLRLKGVDHPFINITLNKDEARQSCRVAFLKPPTFYKKEKYAREEFLELAKEIEITLGINIDVVNTPTFLDNIHDSHDRIYSKSVSYYFQNEYNNCKNEISDITKNMIKKGQEINTEEYKRLLEEQSEKTVQFDKWLENNYDFAFTLASAEEAPKGLEYNDKPDSTLMWTYLGVPTLIAPKFKSPNNLPFGFQIISRKYTDNKLIKFAKLLKEKNIIKNAVVVGE